MEITEDLDMSSHIYIHLIFDKDTRAQETIQKGKQKDSKSRRDGDTSKQGLQDIVGPMPIWTHRDWQYTQGMNKSKSALRGRSGHKVTSLTKKLTLIDNHLQRKKNSYL